MSYNTALIKKSSMMDTPVNSSDFISPPFVFGCYKAGLVNCVYCNTPNDKGAIHLNRKRDEILTAIQSKLLSLGTKTTDSCNSDLHVVDICYYSDLLFTWHSLNKQSSYGWSYIIDWFEDMDNAMCTFSTRFINEDFLTKPGHNKCRVRVCLTPQHVMDKYERHSATLQQRILFINSIYEFTNYEVCMEFSPLIIYPGWLTHYKDLFQTLNKSLSQAAKDELFSIYRFVEYNEASHNINKNTIDSHNDTTLWGLSSQVIKGNGVNRKAGYNNNSQVPAEIEFRNLHDILLPWSKLF